MINKPIKLPKEVKTENKSKATAYLIRLPSYMDQNNSYPLLITVGTRHPPEEPDIIGHSWPW